jgi:transcriptional regulator with XRE-family HTH domain
MAGQTRDDGEPRPTEFGPILRHWRRARGLSQLDLAQHARMSARHLSFLETGRCGPSRDSVLQLGRALALPRSETERLLIVAGHAGDWTRRSADAAGVRRQLAEVAPLLEAYAPFPALISDPDWSVAWRNRAAAALFARLRQLAPSLCVDPVDLRQLLTEQSLGRLIANLPDLLEGVLAGLYQLEPDPVSFGHGRSLLPVLPFTGEPGEAIERAARDSAWEHEIRVRDRGAAFGLRLLSLPFAGRASGFALVLAAPADDASRRVAAAYFEGLLELAA